ncbi:PAS domain S-box protein [Bacillus pinisoli]|uniref:PAS domain S-box protein n=1 Tax=Bacillus pinisoli TaxID=2901866 RepID=UPI001FF28190|nr:PAS domain-containing sensor histidine kinase [Bacillus pinisoli]
MIVNDLNAIEILDRITDGIFSLNRDWNFTHVNKEASRLLFRNREDLLGKNVWIEFPEAVELAFFEMYNKAMKDQAPVAFDAYFLPLHTWFDVKAYPSESGLTVLFKDITEKKQEALKSEQHYKSLFEQHPDAVYSFDCEGNYLSVNKGFEKLVGYKHKEILNSTYERLVDEKYLTITNDHFKKAANGVTQNYDTVVIHKEGHKVPINVTNIPIVVDGKIVGVYGIAKDITLQKHSEEVLVRSEKLSVVGQLSASIAHEIRNPLTSLKGFMQLLKSSLVEVPSYYDIMTDEISRIESITSELLMHAKPQAHSFKEEDVLEITDQVVVLLTSEALMSNVEIITNYDSIPPINCISNQIKQVLINVIKNAIEAMPKGGQLQIAVKKMSEEEICIRIADQGCGIPQEFLEEIGMPFYTTKEKGTGLGMMTTYKIVETHGGKINISSEENKGTTVEVYLPVNYQGNDSIVA